MNKARGPSIPLETCRLGTKGSYVESPYKCGGHLESDGARKSRKEEKGCRKRERLP